MTEVEVPRYQFSSPCTIAVSGATSSGKTSFIKELLAHKNSVFKFPPDRIIYCYGIWQKGFNDIENVEFQKGLPTSDIENKYTENLPHLLIILDDLMDLVVKDDYIQSLFTRGSHHKNITVIYVNQNLYHQGKCSRSINLNTQYYVLFRNPRDVNQISLFGKQLGLGSKLIEAYKDATSKRYGYLLVDISCCDFSDFQLRSHVLPYEDTHVYL